jgi:hypothetical protein
MTSLDRYQIVLLPRREVLVADCSLGEAVAYVRGYHEASQQGRREAVIVPSRSRSLQVGQPLRLARSA